MLPAASAHAVTHTLTFTSVQQAQAKFSATSNGAEDKDVKVIGFDMLSFNFNPATGKVTAGVTSIPLAASATASCSHPPARSPTAR